MKASASATEESGIEQEKKQEVSEPEDEKREKEEAHPENKELKDAAQVLGNATI